MRSNRFLYQLFSCTFLSLSLSSTAISDDRFWIGGNADWVEGSNFQWTSIDEPDPDDVAIFNTNNNVEIGSFNHVAGLRLSNGINLSTADQRLLVAGDLVLSGAGTTLSVAGNDLTMPPVLSLEAHNVIVNSGARIGLGGSPIRTFESGPGSGVFDINSGGTLIGNGLILGGTAGASDIFLINDGTLSAADSPNQLPPLGSIPTPRQLEVAGATSDAQIDLDGTSGNGAVDVLRNQTLFINAALADAFGGSLTMRHDSKLDIETAWTIDGGTTTINNGFVAGAPPFVPSIPAGNATIAGGELTHEGGTIELTAGTGMLTFEGDYVGLGGTLNNLNGGTVVFQGTASLNNLHNYAQGSNAQTIIDGGTTTVNDDNLDLDGVASNADWTVTNGGVLNVLKSSIDGSGGNVLNGDLNFNGGRINVDVDGTAWTSNNRIESNGGGKLIGDTVLIGNNAGPANADVDINSGTLEIAARANFQSDANVNVASGATLIVNNPDTIFSPVNGANNGVFEGDGSLFVRGARFAEDTTFDFSGGTVGLDGRIGTNAAINQVFRPAADTDIEAHLTINAATFDDFGAQGVALPADPQTFSDMNILDQGRLEINLDDPDGTWNVLPNATINYVGNASVDTFLAGSDLQMDGTLNVLGRGSTEARLEIGGTVNIQSGSGSFNLNADGDGTILDDHGFNGGLITGPGLLTAEPNNNLRGHGVIDTDINFSDDSALLASGGLLNVNGTITGVQSLHAAGTSAVLDLALPFNSSITSNGISVGGGRLQGAPITLAPNTLFFRGLGGNGLVTNHLTNNGVIQADPGATSVLTLDNPDSDYDGTSDNGLLWARAADLTILDDASFNFGGKVRVEDGRTFLADGFELQLQGGSTLDLNGGTFRATGAHNDFFGQIDVAAGTSTIDTNLTRIRNSANVALDGDLQLVDRSQIDSGATFSGGGRLINPSGSFMTLADDADVGVFLENNGDLELEDSSAAQVDVAEFAMESDAQVLLDIIATTMGDFDHLNIAASATLAGELALFTGPDLLEAYDTVSIVSTGTGVAGVFDTVRGVTGRAGVASDEGLAVTYTATSVDVTRALLGDANLDMSVDVLGDAFTLVGNLGTLTGGTWANGDFNGDGAVDVLGDAFLLVSNLGNTASSAPSASAVPEPSVLTPLIFLATMQLVKRRHEV